MKDYIGYYNKYSGEVCLAWVEEFAVGDSDQRYSKLAWGRNWLKKDGGFRKEKGAIICCWCKR